MTIILGMPFAGSAIFGLTIFCLMIFCLMILGSGVQPFELFEWRIENRLGGLRLRPPCMLLR